MVDTESDNTATGAGALAGGTSSRANSRGMVWAAIWKYAKETAGPAEANSIEEGIRDDQPVPCWEPRLTESCDILRQKELDDQEIETEEVAPMAVHIESNHIETGAGKPAGSAAPIVKKTQGIWKEMTGKLGWPGCQKAKQ